MFVQQVAALLRKNVLLLRGHPVQLLLCLLFPLLALILASVAASGQGNSIRTNHYTGVDITQPKLSTLALPTCFASSCKPAVYFAPNDVYHATVMRTLADSLGLQYGSDIVPHASVDQLANVLLERQLTTLQRNSDVYGVAFASFADSTAAPATMDEASTALKAGKGTYYTMWEANNSPAFEQGMSGVSFRTSPVAMKLELDKAIYSVRSQMLHGTAASLDVQLRFAPWAAPEGVEMSSFSFGSSQSEKSRSQVGGARSNQFVAAISALGFAPMFIVMLTLHSNEKHSGLLGVLRKLGLHEAAYWLASLVTVAVLVLAASLLSLLAYPAFSDDVVFKQVSVGYLLAFQFTTGLQLVSFGLLFSAALSAAYATNVLSGIVLLVFIAAEAICGMLVMSKIGSDPTSGGLFHDAFAYPHEGWLLSLLPFFTHGKLITDFVAGTTLPSGGLTRFTDAMAAQPWGKDKYEYYPGYGRTPFKYTAPSTVTTLVVAVAYSLLYYVLCWYLNQVSSSRSGTGQPLWFPFMPSYWGMARRSAGLDGDSAAALERSRAEQGLVACGLQKTFTTARFGCLARKHHRAVKHVSLSVARGKILSLLGQNGAGKSTSINMITGLLHPDAGEVFVMGRRLRTERAAVQQQLGVTTQDDILWPALSAAEHVRLYATFKGVPRANMAGYIAARLDAVGLAHVAQQAAGQYSGGMQRRLSIVLCSVGEPALCILDEPTTGLDPINRRKVWTFIESLKRHAAVILTTHLLDEADALGDDVCIVGDGEVKAHGTSLHLKRTYGSGYEISVLTVPGADMARAANVLRAYVPDAALNAEGSDLVVMTVPHASTERLPALFAFLQSHDAERVALFREWGVQNASLEQVFLNVCGHRKAHADTGTRDDTAVDVVDRPFDMLPFTPRRSLLHQVWAVVAKNAMYQRRQLKSTIFTFLVIIGCFVGQYMLPLYVPCLPFSCALLTLPTDSLIPCVLAATWPRLRTT